MSRIWKFKDVSVKDISPELVSVAGDLPILAKLLAIRGITDPKEAQAFLDLEACKPTSGREFPDMEKAISRIQEAIAQE